MQTSRNRVDSTLLSTGPILIIKFLLLAQQQKLSNINFVMLCRLQRIQN